MPLDVCVCFTLNAVDVPLFCGVRTNATAQAWLEEDRANRFLVLTVVDQEPNVFEPQDLFEYAGITL